MMEEMGMERKLKTVIEEYYYDSMTEKDFHCMEMVENGYEDSGQIEKNTGSFNNPEYRIYGRYVKYEK